MLNRIILLVVSFLILIVVTPGITEAEEAAQEEGWKFGAELYFWGASIGGKTASGGDIDIGFSDVVDNLDMALMGLVAVRKGRLLFLADIIFLDVEGDNGGKVTLPIGPGGGDFDVEADAELQGWVVTPAVGYTVIYTGKARLDIMAGARYLRLDTDFTVDPDLELSIGTLPLDERKISVSGDVWDGIVGVRGQLNLGEKWYLPCYLDIGTGDSDLTWQAIGGVGYKFSRVDVILAYRHLEWDFDDSDAFDDLDFSGPFVGVKFIF